MQMPVKEKTPRFQIPYVGLATAFLWAISPIFIRLGLDDMPSPLLGVAIGLGVNTLVYGVLVWSRRAELRGFKISGVALRWQLAAAFFVAIATWARWIALDTVPVAIVTALSRLSVPLVIVLSVLMLDQTHEQVNWRVWLGGTLIIAGALILTFTT